MAAKAAFDDSSYEALLRSAPDKPTRKALSHAHGFGYGEGSAVERIILLRKMRTEVTLLSEEALKWMENREAKIRKWASDNAIPIDEV